MSSMRTRSYSEMASLPSFRDRFEYLSLKGRVGQQTFGFERWMNQSFYNSSEWRNLRHRIIARDEGRDLGVPGYEIHDRITIHHINPMTIQDFETGNPLIVDPNNLISTTHNTHNAIHYGDDNFIISNTVVERSINDTIPWKR